MARFECDDDPFVIAKSMTDLIALTRQPLAKLMAQRVLAPQEAQLRG
jgi:hypothetical protein